MWNSLVSIQWVAGSNQFITVKVEENGHMFLLSIIYAKCNRNDRRELWADLENMGTARIP